MARPGLDFDDVKIRMKQRFEHLGIKVVRVLEEEHCFIPMGGVLPKQPQRTLGIGGTAGMVHPSTGFMLSLTLKSASTLIDALKEGALFSRPRCHASLPARPRLVARSSSLRRRLPFSSPLRRDSQLPISLRPPTSPPPPPPHRPDRARRAGPRGGGRRPRPDGRRARRARVGQGVAGPAQAHPHLHVLRDGDAHAAGHRGHAALLRDVLLAAQGGVVGVPQLADQARRAPRDGPRPHGALRDADALRVCPLGAPLRPLPPRQHPPGHERLRVPPLERPRPPAAPPPGTRV